MRCNDGRGAARWEFAMLAALFVAALLVRVYFLPFFRVISADGVGYVGAARALIRGDLSALINYGVVFPTLTAGVSLLGVGTETAGRIVSMTMGSLLVVPLYLLGREFFSRQAAAVACILVIAWPELRMWSGEVATQASYVTLLVSWYWLLWQAYRRGTFGWAIAAGAVAGLCYLTRPESLISFVAMAPLLLLPAGGRSLKERILLTAAAVGVFLLLLFPFVLLVHHYTGAWQLTGKGGVTLADAIGEYLGRPDLKHEPAFQGIGILEVLRKYPDFVWQNSQRNLAKTFAIMVPLYMWCAVAVGFFAGGWERGRVMERIYLIASFAPLAIIIPFFFVGPEYLQPYLPVLFLWVGNAACTVERKVLRPIATGSLERFTSWNPVAVAGAVALTAYTFVGQIPPDAGKPYDYRDDGGRYDQRRIGELLKKQLPPGSKIMSRWGRISFYAEMDIVPMPQTSLSEMVDIARKKGVNYVVVDGMVMGMRPQFEPLFLPLLQGPEKIIYAPAPGRDFSPVPGLRLRLLSKDPSSIGVAVYEVTG